MLLRYFHTLRHFKRAQLAHRLLKKIRDIGDGLRPVPTELPAATARPLILPKNLHRDPWNSGAALAAGTFDFLRQARPLGWPPDWSAPGATLSWRFFLHAFGYLHLLPPQLREALCLHWIEQHPRRAAPAFDPYPLSLRIIHWCQVGLEHPRILASLADQARFLAGRLERDIPGNHLLENARALVWAGSRLAGDEAASWLRLGERVVHAELGQILADGGHFERSPMYHALVLEGLLEVRQLAQDPHLRRELDQRFGPMADFLHSLSHPDGDPAFFNDTVRAIAPASSPLEEQAAACAGRPARFQSSFPASGYHVHREGDLYFALDAGPLGPDHLPAHAHSDLFSFELSLARKRVFVNSGVFEYAAGPMRDYCRSAWAHNTASVDGADHGEFWGSFRLARRYPPEGVAFSSGAQGFQFTGLFKGFAQLVGDGIAHRRNIEGSALRREVTIRDEFSGQGTHLIESFLHLHPDCRVEPGAPVMVRLPGWPFLVELTVLEGALAIEKGWYCPEFGLKLENAVLRIWKRTLLPAALALRISWREN